MATKKGAIDKQKAPRDRILRAAAGLLRGGGPRAVTTRGVAEAAGVQPPAIYRLFGDKEGLLDAVVEYEAARYVSAKARDEQTDDPVADLRSSFDRNVRFGLDHPELFLLLTDPSRIAGSPVAAQGFEILRGRLHRIAAAGLLRVPEGRAVALVQAAGVGAVLALLTSDGADRDLGLPEAIFDAVLREILADAAPAEEDRVAAAAVTLRAALPDLEDFTPGESALLGELLERLTGEASA